MREVLPALMASYERGEPVAMATVVRTWRSAPRPAGASMLVTAGGEAVGSVSGGCVEGARLRTSPRRSSPRATPALQTLRGQRRRRLRGRADLRRNHRGLRGAGDRTRPGPRGGRGIGAGVVAEEPVAWQWSSADPAARLGRHLVVRPDVAGVARARRGWTTRGGRRRRAACSRPARTGILRYGSDGRAPRRRSSTLFVTRPRRAAHAEVFGAVDFAAALSRVGELLGYRVTVCDARAGLRDPAPLPRRGRGGDRLAAPLSADRGAALDERTVICVLTHDPKFDVPRSRSPCDSRSATSAPWAPAAPTRTGSPPARGRPRRGRSGPPPSPIGLDLGARTPEETAVRIAAEIVQDRWGGSGGRLKNADGPIHAGAPR